MSYASMHVHPWIALAQMSKKVEIYEEIPCIHVAYNNADGQLHAHDYG